MLFMINALLTGQVTNLVMGTLSTIFVNDGSLSKYDIAYEYSDDKKYSFELPRLQRSFFVDDSTHTKLSKLQRDQEQTFASLLTNVETDMFRKTAEKCDEAEIEQRR